MRKLSTSAAFFEAAYGEIGVLTGRVSTNGIG